MIFVLVPLLQVGRTERLVEAAEAALLHLDCGGGRDVELSVELEKALTPFRKVCEACGVPTSPLHHSSAPYFCDYARSAERDRT